MCLDLRIAYNQSITVKLHLTQFTLFNKNRDTKENKSKVYECMSTNHKGEVECKVSVGR